MTVQNDKTATKTAPTAVKAAIQNASGHVQSAIVNTEHSALAAVARVEDTMASMKSSFDGVKTFGSNLTEVVDNAGRTTLSGVVAINGSLMTYGRELVTDTVELGRKTIETRSLTDALALHTAYTERRLQAMFHTVAAVNTLAQNNVMAIFQPFASMVSNAGNTTDATIKSMQKTAFKTAA
jgi:hypothetical protein